jgi:hypothetical protein
MGIDARDAHSGPVDAHHDVERLTELLVKNRSAAPRRRSPASCNRRCAAARATSVDARPAGRFPARSESTRPDGIALTARNSNSNDQLPTAFSHPRLGSWDLGVGSYSTGRTATARRPASAVPDIGLRG